MLLIRCPHTPAREFSPETNPDTAQWIDLINPTEDEITQAEKFLNLHIPKREDLEEIESSSRHYERDDALYLSTPLVRRVEDVSFSRPVGFILNANHLVTIRYTDYFAFDLVSNRLAELPSNQPTPSAPELLTELIEEIINRLADTLEALGRTLDTISHRVFHAEHPKDRARAGAILRETLRRLGTTGDLTSSVRDSLLGIDRVRIYFENHIEQDTKKAEHSPSFSRTIARDLPTRLTLAGKDIASLNDFGTQLLNKIQFLLDATLGFINIEQNDGMKVLTVVSSIGITPTLIAGIYGMNFKDMPELTWKYGYPYGLTLMALSIILPLYWFWRRGWFGTR